MVFRFKRIFFTFLLIGCVVTCGAAPRPSGRTPVSNTATPAANNATPAVRAARGTPVVRGGNVAAPVQNVSVSRSATTPTNTPKVSSARSATTPTTGKVKARAATQSAIVNGTKISAASKNVAVNQECQTKFDGCMDSFCMMDGGDGGRCRCDNKVKELDAFLKQIDANDKKSYMLATAGVEKIEMGADGDAVFTQVQSVKDEFIGQSSKKQNDKLAIFFNDDSDEIQQKVQDVIGAELYQTSFELCSEYIPECKSELPILNSLYKQRVRSDCVAYENSLKKQRDASAQKLAAAQTALREAALEQYRSANKYDLGQCTIEFKQCMKTTAGCGDDFSGCTTVAATAEAQTATHSRKKVSKQHTIKLSNTTIEIAAATYDTLDAKKPLCMGVTDSCTNVRDQVWDAFLRESAPQIKSAELIAEDKFRTQCVTNISNCFQKACKDNLDPNDPDGSYDTCLSHPEAFEAFCKVQIQPCQAAEPKIMESVLARLSSMRTDACTKEFKECLTSEDRCGEDYSQCIGLDTATIVAMCPTEKLTACYHQYGNKTIDVYETLVKIADGIFLNIDNNMYETCQKALDESMLRVCGDTDNCDKLALDAATGTRSFTYQVCEYDGFDKDTNEPLWTGKCYDSVEMIPKSQYALPGNRGWAGKLSGVVYWGGISYDGDKNTFTGYEEYVKIQEEIMGQKLNDEQKKIIRERIFNSEITSLNKSVQDAIRVIESDQMVQYCMTGRTFQGMRGADGQSKILGDANNARFPNLTKQVRQIIASSALRTAQQKYMQKYDDEMSRMMKDRKYMADVMNQQFDKDSAAKACAALKDSLALPTHKAPEVSQAGLWIGVAIVAIVTIVACVFTFGTAAGAGVPIIMAMTGSLTALKITTAVAVTGLVATAAFTTDAAIETVNQKQTAHVENWNYVYTIDTQFNPESGVCTKTVTTQNCKKVKKNYCKEWSDAETTTSTINLL